MFFLRRREYFLRRREYIVSIWSRDRTNPSTSLSSGRPSTPPPVYEIIARGPLPAAAGRWWRRPVAGSKPALPRALLSFSLLRTHLPPPLSLSALPGSPWSSTSLAWAVRACSLSDLLLSGLDLRCPRPGQAFSCCCLRLPAIGVAGCRALLPVADGPSRHFIWPGSTLRGLRMAASVDWWCSSPPVGTSRPSRCLRLPGVVSPVLGPPPRFVLVPLVHWVVVVLLRRSLCPASRMALSPDSTLQWGCAARGRDRQCPACIHSSSSPLSARLHVVWVAC
jgi:hypothetical protein